MDQYRFSITLYRIGLKTTGCCCRSLLDESESSYGVVTSSTNFTSTRSVTLRQVFSHIKNKFVQSNLGRGPRRGAVAHVRCIVPIGYNGAPQIRPQKYPFPWTDPQTPLRASSLDPSDLRCQTASESDPPFFHNALDTVVTDRAHKTQTRFLCI